MSLARVGNSTPPFGQPAIGSDGFTEPRKYMHASSRLEPDKAMDWHGWFAPTQGDGLQVPSEACDMILR
ncbi:hypothetical protein CH063_05659 [Colletotrichum higginsianum]|uniref:Uncharacterized protein n=1 Tax=Colletotrichum higginsianum (strain IMI 349063) TaxID=759273 RepID=H1UZR9_COLHI|nr:hypothetical protein CH063_05659 [Colletotrichum higginsianum]